MADDERRAARAVLGLAPGADAAAVRAAYRRLARDLHPDRGGDPDAFDRVTRAYRVLADGDEATPPIVPGRPSRAAAPSRPHLPSEGVAPLDPDELAAAAAATARLDVALLARWLATPTSGAHPLRPFAATSRAPSARTNRAAHLLAETSTSWLRVTVVERTVVRAELRAIGRRARAAVDSLRLDGAERGRGWTRRRGSSSTSVHQERTVDDDPRITALAVADEVGALLERLAWPLDQWRPSSG